MMQNSAKKLEYEERFNDALLKLKACQEEAGSELLEMREGFKMRNPQQLCGCGL